MTAEAFCIISLYDYGRGRLNCANRAPPSHPSNKRSTSGPFTRTINDSFFTFRRRAAGAVLLQRKLATAQGAAREGANPSLRAQPRHSLRTSSTSACGRRLIAAANCTPVIDCRGQGGRVTWLLARGGGARRVRTVMFVSSMMILKESGFRLFCSCSAARKSCRGHEDDQAKAAGALAACAT